MKDIENDGSSQSILRDSHRSSSINSHTSKRKKATSSGFLLRNGLMLLVLLSVASLILLQYHQFHQFLLLEEEALRSTKNSLLSRFRAKHKQVFPQVNTSYKAPTHPIELPNRPRVGSFLPPEIQNFLSDKELKDLQWINKPVENYFSTPYLPLSKPCMHANFDTTVTLPGAKVESEMERICTALERANRTKLSALFRNCFPNTLQTTVQMLQADRPDSPPRAFLITGDIDLMWLRDSSAQVHHYIQLPALRNDLTVVRVVEGVITQQMWFIRYSPYGSSFRLDFRKHADDCMCPQHTKKARNVHVSMHNYELDSLLYPVWLSHEWWNKTHRTHIFTQEWVESAWLILDLFAREQRHFLAQDKNMSQNDCQPDVQTSCYRYLELKGKEHSGPTVGYTGMIWSPCRPSDDQQTYGYLVPSNGMAVLVLGRLAEVAEQVLQLPEMAKEAKRLQKQVMEGIERFGIVLDGNGNKMLAYEVDGLGKSNLMDDANVPSLLSLPYFGFADIAKSLSADPALDWDAILDNTRNFVWSNHNPHFHSGKVAEGIGSPHTPSGMIWHMSIVMKGLTATATTGDKDEELKAIFDMLVRSDGGKDFMHESFSPDNPARFTRPWFAWSNSLFAELVIQHFDWLTRLHPLNQTDFPLPPTSVNKKQPGKGQRHEAPTEKKARERSTNLASVRQGKQK